MCSSVAPSFGVDVSVINVRDAREIEDRSYRRMRTLVTQMAHSRPVR